MLSVGTVSTFIAQRRTCWLLQKATTWTVKAGWDASWALKASHRRPGIHRLLLRGLPVQGDAHFDPITTIKIQVREAG